MANIVANIAKGRVVEYYSRVKSNDPANAALILVPIETSGLEADSVLIDKDDLAAWLSGTTNEQTTMGRKTLTDVELSALPAPDDALRVVKQLVTGLALTTDTALGLSLSNGTLPPVPSPSGHYLQREGMQPAQYGYAGHRGQNSNSCESIPQACSPDGSGPPTTPYGIRAQRTHPCVTSGISGAQSSASDVG